MHVVYSHVHTCMNHGMLFTFFGHQILLFCPLIISLHVRIEISFRIFWPQLFRQSKGIYIIFPELMSDFLTFAYMYCVRTVSRYITIYFIVLNFVCDLEVSDLVIIKHI